MITIYIWFPIHFVHVCVGQFFHFEDIPLYISRILFSSVENTIIFCCEILDLLILNLSFVARILKWNFEVDYFMLCWFNPIAFHLILHIQRFFVITNRDCHGLPMNFQTCLLQSWFSACSVDRQFIFVLFV